MKKHKISWLNIPGYIPTTWNPIIGCDKISPGCDHCYAEIMANRIAGIQSLQIGDTPYSYRKVKQWDGTTELVESMIERPFTWKKPRAVFVCSMSDLFHKNTPFEWIDKVIDVIRWNKQHLFILLTKRPERMREYFTKHVPEKYMMDNGNYLDNVWIGVTAENQEMADKRIPTLLDIPAKVRFVSAEPLLGPIDFASSYLDSARFFELGTLNWVIVGPETGQKARDYDLRWIAAMGNQCKSLNVPFFDKKALTPIQQFPNI